MPVINKITDRQRLSLMKAYMNELERICHEKYQGDWEKMPQSHKGLPVDWKKVIRVSKVPTTPAGAYRLVTSTANNDDLMNQLS